MKKLNESELNRMARKLANAGKRGWLTPTGDFFEAEETPPVRMAGLELGGHAKAALAYLDQHFPDLSELLYTERYAAGFETWEECEDLIKTFMARHGFKRVAPE